jgi:hypothetical protein
MRNLGMLWQRYGSIILSKGYRNLYIRSCVLDESVSTRGVTSTLGRTLPVRASTFQ